MRQSTILVTLFSPDEDTSGKLDHFVRTIQNGINAVPNSLAPNIHCLYRREHEVFQYQLTKNGSSVPKPTDKIDVASIKDQLRDFFRSTYVSTGGPVYLLVGAHGQPTGSGLGGIINHLPQFLLSLISFFPLSTYRVRVTQGWRSVFRDSLPVGQLFAADPSSDPDFITLTEFNDVLKQAFQKKPLKSLILHSCSLSSLETIYEIHCAEQHIACESELRGWMDASNWITVMANGGVPGELTRAASPARGLFSSHRINQSLETPEFIKCLNNLGSNLKPQIASQSGTIDDARAASIVDVPDLVDVCQFCDGLKKVCSPSVLGEMKQAIVGLQLESVPRPPRPGFQGIGMFLPHQHDSSGMKNLPAAFQKAACDWVAFLNLWTS